MPYDIAAVERGYGECDVEWQGETILLRYRADLNNRALIAMKRVAVGVLTFDGVTRLPDVEALVDELLKTLLPSGPDVPKAQRGWDIIDNGRSIPITYDTLVDLPFGLLSHMIGAIFRDVNDPNRKRLSVFNSSSSAEESSESHPITLDSSETRNGQGSIHETSPDSEMTLATIPAGASGPARSGSPRSKQKTSSP